MAAMDARRADWYFDFISPYAWLQAERLRELPAQVQLTCKPVLFAGLLDHWRQLGPAEIEPKRLFTYRYAVWRAARLGLPYKAPSAHPFNPLRLLRLAIALGCERDLVLRLFRFVWSEGRRPDDDADWGGLVAELGVPDADVRVGAPEVKAQLRANTDEAIARGVFGVPTLVIDDQLFWGVDATDMAFDYLGGDPLFHTAEMHRAERLPRGAERPRKNR
ncbi:MAG TPA: 2-hydroxychromene-2-carboxylate isomerase [Burkholderiales bacterium]|nr:2-hydroxychromene-2-carboxylate isomerase [Burkholderiales bacterium]